MPDARARSDAGGIVAGGSSTTPPVRREIFGISVEVSSPRPAPHALHTAMNVTNASRELGRVRERSVSDGPSDRFDVRILATLNRDDRTIWDDLPARLGAW